MKKLICALIGVAALVAYATTYIQTSPTGTAPWKPVKDSVSQARLADSARQADTARAAWKADSARVAWFAHAATYADSSRASGLADSAKRAGWAPLDTVEVRNFIWKGISTAHLRLPLVGNGAFLKMANDGSDSVVASHFLMYDDSLLEYQYVGNTHLIPSHFRAVYNIGDASYGYAVAYGWPDGISFGKGYGIGSSPFDTLFRIPDNGPTWSKSGYRVLSGTAKGFLKADGSVDSSGVFAGVTDSARASHISDSAKALVHYGTLAQDTAIAKKVASDTATVLRTGIASAITTSEAYATARISDSLTANARAWTTLMAAKSSIHDTATALRTYIGSASTTGNAATATKLATARTITTSGDVTGTPTNFDGTANITIPTTLPTLLTAGSAGSAAAVPTLTWDAKGRLTAVGSAAISIPHTQINDWTTATSGFQSTLGFTPIQQGGGTAQGANKIYIGWGTDGVLRLQVDATNFGSTWPIDIAGTASVAASVAWTNVTGRPTALSSFTNDAGYLTANQSISLKGAVTGSGTTSIATSFANTHLAGINQELTTTSSPTFAGLYTTGTYGACGVFAGNGDAASYTTYNLKIKSWWGIGFESYDGVTRILMDTRTGGISTLGGINASGLITANGGISGNLTGHASLDLPLAGGTMTGSLLGGASTDIGSTTAWLRNGFFTALYVGNAAVLTANQSISLKGAVTGSGTTSIATSFANTHLAGINQDLTTTSSPTFGTVYGNVSGTGTSSFYGVTISGGGSLTVNGTSTFNYASTFYQRLTAQNISAWSIVPTTTAVYDLGSSSLVWNNVYASAMYEAGVSLSAKYAPIAVPSYFSTNAARTLSSQSGSVYVYTVSQTTTQTLQDGTVSGETITVKNAQNSSTLVLTGNINAGSSTITSLSTAVLVWNGSTWY